MPNVAIKQCAFSGSATSIHNTPASKHSEIAFLGRSNVGKSTFINTILGANLAKSSSTPGKTQLINFYTSLWIKDADSISLTLIDLPGFGYAKVSKTIKARWEKYLLDFLIQRTSIKLFIHLLDARHTDLAIDVEVSAMIKSMLKGDQQMLKVYTKADKLNQSALYALKMNLKQTGQNHLIFSALPNRSHKLASIHQVRNVILAMSLGECVEI